MEWQPIETAPHEGGDDILLWDGKSVLFGRFGWSEEGKPVFFYDGPGFRDCTHWMPLPEPPGSEGGAA